MQTRAEEAEHSRREIQVKLKDALDKLDRLKRRNEIIHLNGGLPANAALKNPDADTSS